MKSQTEHIISILFQKCLHYTCTCTCIYFFYTARKLALNLCYYQNEYKLTNCIHALQQSKDITCTCIPINKIITALI